MPVYNCEKYLRQAMESVLRQSYRDFELIVVSDGSRDSSLSIARSFTDARIRIVENPRNMGISASRNRALAESRGRYIAWLDSDDIALENRLERQAEALDSNPDAGLCHSNFAEIDETGKVVKNPWNTGPTLPTEWLMLWTNPIAQSTVMLRKSLLEGGASPYNGECDPAEDYDLWTRLCMRTNISYMHDVLVCYRSVQTSAFHKNSKRALLKSIQSNERYVQLLMGEAVPSFHKYLTSFGGALESAMESVSAGALKEWYVSAGAALAKRKNWSGDTAAQIARDIQRRMVGLLSEEPRIYYASGTRASVFKESPLLFMKLQMGWWQKGLRHAAKAVLKPRSRRNKD